MYRLSLYDIVIAEFNLFFDERGFRAENFVVVSGNEHLLPLSLEPTNEGIVSWLKKRTIPKNREFVDKILSKIGLNHNNTKGIIDICKALSLNDSYWVYEEGFEKNFAQCNLFQNNFSNLLALVAYGGYGSSLKSKFMSSPELTTNGQLPKCWRRISGEIVLFKGGTSRFANSGLEPFSEFYASQVANAMGVKHVEYGLSGWKHSISSTCRLFTDIDHSFIPIGYLVKSGGFMAAKDYCESLGDDFYQDFLDMIAFDAVTMNTDRHYGNYGFIIDNKTNKPISLAPIFDNGASLLPYAMDTDELKSEQTLREYMKTRTPIMYDDFVASVKKYLGKRQLDKIKKLINFKFKKHLRYNLPEPRLKKLERMIEIQVESLLK
ncbi:MAG: XRE family transcriptional regulator [Bacilli bacterium]|nr:XRE family transcriptional regulator [Bacilli bacterium]